jgi:lipoprotein-anchoring transpeptidase ErfK/SrfK
MVDYYSILARVVASLSPNTSEQRRALYDRARKTLADKIGTVDPSVSSTDLKAESAALEAAIQRIERDLAPRPAAPPRPADATRRAARAGRHRDMGPLKDTRRPLRIAAGVLGAVLIVGAGAAIYSFWPRNLSDLRNISSSRPVTAAVEEPAKSGYVNLRQLVYYRSNQPVGTIIVDKTQTFLYVVRPNASALRYSIGVGPECITLAGLFHVVRKESSDSAARVLYLDKDYRIHGSAAPAQPATAGCIRLVNDDVIYLYDRTPLESRVVVSN